MNKQGSSERTHTKMAFAPSSGVKKAVRMDNPWKILVVDDEPEVHNITKMMLKRDTFENRKFEFIHAYSAKQALEVLVSHVDIAVILLDVVMETETAGLDVATKIRKQLGNKIVRIILRTGQPGDVPDKHVIVDYDINDYKEKSELTSSKLFTAVVAALRGYSQLCEIDNAAKETMEVNEKLEEMVKHRTIELEASLAKLIKTKNHLVQSEKMVSLGRLVAGVAHELNTPIGICLTSDSFLHEQAENFNQLFLAGTLRRKDLVDFLSTAMESTEISLSNLRRASDLIGNFKQVAADASNHKPRSFNLYDYIVQVLHSLQGETKHTKLVIEVEGDKKLVIHREAGIFSQIITNLVMNSLSHAYNIGDKGRIIISVTHDEEKVHLSYSDDGRGMTADTVANVFEPFFTTKRGLGGSGLGMSILYNLVIQRLSGEVLCTSELGKGSTFTMSFPLLSSE